MFTEAQTGKPRVYTPYSSLNKQFQAYVKDDNEILTEDGILKAMSFNVVIYGTTAVLVDVANFFGKTETQGTHEL